MRQPAVIGIVGGGQLGRMLTLAALPLGFKVVVLDPGENCPAKAVGAEQVIGDLNDPTALRQLAEKSDVITIEIEHLNAAALQAIADEGTPVHPAPSTIKLIQDKYEQKVFLRKAGIPVADFTVIPDKTAALKALKEYKGKMLIKTRHGAYDGRGNMVVNSETNIDRAFDHFAGKQLYAEKFVPFTKELAVMVARDISGNTALYPIVETIHERNICLEVHAPADITKVQADKAQHIAQTVAGLLEGAGTFGIEMFLTKDGEVLLNEIAPRVHNSGHYTMEANHTSQFEQHIRAITGLPLGSTKLVVPTAVMINILGERNGETTIQGLHEALNLGHVSVHLYGKSPTKVDRKMGHLTATGDTLEKTAKQARRARKHISV